MIIAQTTSRSVVLLKKTTYHLVQSLNFNGSLLQFSWCEYFSLVGFLFFYSEHEFWSKSIILLQCPVWETLIQTQAFVACWTQKPNFLSSFSFCTRAALLGHLLALRCSVTYSRNAALRSFLFSIFFSHTSQRFFEKNWLFLVMRLVTHISHQTESH